MFKHILVPTDGSTLSLRAAKYAVRFAKVHGARITAFYAAPEYHANISGDYLPVNFVPPDVFKKQVKITATKYLEQLVEHGFLLKHKIGRSNFYINQPLLELFLKMNTEKSTPANDQTIKTTIKPQ